MPRQILIISAHPDDETLGCGGTILKHKSQGDNIHWLIATSAFEPRWSSKLIEIKEEEIQAIIKYFGITQTYRPKLPTTLLDSLPLDTIIHAFSPAFQNFYDTVYIVGPGDTHTDHQITFEAAWVHMKNFRALSKGPKKILCFETLSSTDAAPPQKHSYFIPNAWSDISQFIEQKCHAMTLYKSESQPDPLPRGSSAMKALARYRGSQVGIEYAEAFMILRDILE